MVRLLPLLAILAGCTGPPPDRGLAGEAFGTRWTVRLRGEGPDPAAVRRAVEAELDAVDRSMSNWRADSELSRLNRSRETGPLPLSEPLARVLETSLRVHRDSGGAFDITVGPLLRLFGFGPGGDPDRPGPDPAALADAASRVGSGRLAIERLPGGGPALRRRSPGVELDLSGIAKGHAVDRVSAVLADLGFGEHLVEVGGEIRARGGWRVGVEDPSGGLPARLHHSFPLRDLAMATSGGYRDFRVAEGEGEGRYWTHLLDPRSSRPVERRAGSVTVLAASCLEADAWATALFVLGPREGHRLAESRGLAALFLTANPDGTVADAATTAFAAAIRSE